MTAAQPNIILIMTDQQRFDTLAAWGASHMITPHMDRLADAGVNFRQAFCPGATCIASRAAIFTGMYAHNSGVYTFQNWSEHRVWVQDLNDAGYHCVNMGKMHYSPRDVPGGFHERVIVENPTNTTAHLGGADDDWGRFLRLHGIERPNFRHRSDGTWMSKHQGVAWHEEERFHSDVFIGDSTVAWVRSYRGRQPFFLQVGLTGPHEPWDPLPRHLAQYDGRELPRPVLRAGEAAEKAPQHRAHQLFHAQTDHESRIDLSAADAAGIDHMRRHYYAKITTVDEQIGKIMAALEARGLLETSLIIFCSDHGELLGDHGLAYKWLMYDPIVHVPLIICPPRQGGLAAQPAMHSAIHEVHDLVSLIDLGPTILAAAGIPIPDYLEGRSLLPYLEANSGDKAEDKAGREIATVTPRQWVASEDNYQIMLRSEQYKLIYYIGQTKGGQEQGDQAEGDLYDLRQDPDELWNKWHAPEYAEVKQQLLQELLAWFTTSVYYNSAYKRERLRQERLRWPDAEDARLHGGNLRPKQVPWL